ncbi:twitching motility protein PilT [candidate division KSB3 bacterium]|uniref:Twitching motility protein PilT n=1 Tax=candidate division KSB3 bacterium TaxID=2044937 RepID=A0A9D5JU03_9BACT|nr:twitching motility protein PilT [candidate division KSB3 bacterium]MBD3323976.1 twitching motility protein PilT [candidate division KSB3 bacterium]
MFQVTLRFYEELNDFLPPQRRKIDFSHTLAGKTSVKDLIESLGVPHTEVDLILVNQESVAFSYTVQPDDRISVYPVFEAFDISAMTKLRPTPLRTTRFILDVHLGKLAVYLRFVGCDALYRNDYQDDEIAAIAARDHRIVLTRDRKLLHRTIITHGYWIRATDPRQQFAEVVQRFHLTFPSPFRQRCSRCNTPLAPISREQLTAHVDPTTLAYYEEFYHCPTCDTIYWKGTHYHNMLKQLGQILN